MKRYIFVFLWLLLVLSFAAAQSQTMEQPSESTPEKASGPFLGQSLNWLLGNWEGEGTQSNRAFSSKLAVNSALDGTAILISRESSGGYTELILLGYDKNSKKNVATLYDNRYHTGLFTCTLKEKELLCGQVVSLPDYVSQRTYKLRDDGTLSFFIERKNSENQQLHKAVEIVFKKK